MLALVLSLLAMSSAISSAMLIYLIATKARDGWFPPRTRQHQQFAIYAGLLVTVLTMLSYTAKEAALDAMEMASPSASHSRGHGPD